MRTKELSFSELAYQVFPEELTTFYEKNISLYALLRKIRKVNESLAFDIWRYLLRKAEAKRKRFEQSLVNAYEFRFYESAYCYAKAESKAFPETCIVGKNKAKRSICRLTDI